MMGGNDKLTMAGSGKPRCSWPVARMWLLAAMLSAAAAGTAIAGDNQAPADATAAGKAVQQAPEKPALPAPAAPPAPPAPGLSFPAQPPAVNKPGFLHEFGRWWDNARGKFEDFKKKSNGAAKDAAAATQDAMKNAAEATKDAATAIVRLPNTRVLRSASAARRRRMARPTVKPRRRTPAVLRVSIPDSHLAFVRRRTVRRAVLLSGRTPAEGKCPVETVVLLAACQ